VQPGRRRAQFTNRVEAHEKRLMVADARSYGMPLNQFIVLMWRNWHETRERLRVIPPYPVDPYVPKKER